MSGLQSVTETKKFGIEDVVSQGLCVGCGACAVASSSNRIQRNAYGAMQAELRRTDGDRLRESRVCPFSDDSATEDQLASVYLPETLSHDSRTGKYHKIFAGRNIGDAVLEGSSSGGLTTWLCAELLADGVIDGVIHIGEPVAVGGDLFEFRISRTKDELFSRRKSQYYSASMDSAIAAIAGDGKRYAFVGVPCYVKAIRSLCEYDAALKQQIVLTVGLVCGHMKSSAFSELLAWQVGVAPADLARVDFRRKDPTKTVGQYKFVAFSKDGSSFEATSGSLIGGNWGHATFQLESCDYCDDIFAETADVVFGDAWLSKYDRVWQGTNVVISRNLDITARLEAAASMGVIALDPLSLDEIVESQNGNFRHRRDGLSVRLLDDLQAGIARPKKRVTPGSRSVGKVRVSIVRLRKKMASKSHVLFHEAKALGSLQHYLKSMQPFAEEMAEISRRSLFRRVFDKARRVLFN